MYATLSQDHIPIYWKLGLQSRFSEAKLNISHPPLLTLNCAALKINRNHVSFNLPSLLLESYMKTACKGAIILNNLNMCFI